MPQGLKDCKFYSFKLPQGPGPASLVVVRCPNSSTTTGYKNGKLDGERKRWDYDGELEFHHIYKNGELIKDYLK